MGRVMGEGERAWLARAAVTGPIAAASDDLDRGQKRGGSPAAVDFCGSRKFERV